MQREVSLDNPTVSLEQTMVAMQKAQIGFAATLQVRNRLVQAYSEIMSMRCRSNRASTSHVGHWQRPSALARETRGARC